MTKCAIKKPSIFYRFNGKGGENMKTVLLAILCCLLLVGCGQKALVVEDGVEYRIVSFGSTTTETTSGEMVPTYLITFTFVNSDGDSESPTRGTVAVPRAVLEKDESLSPNGIVWNAPQTIEGLTYRSVRWNPAKIEPAQTEELIIEEEPLRKK